MRRLSDMEVQRLERSRPERTDGWAWYTVPEAVERGLASLPAIRSWCNGKQPPAGVVLVDVGTRGSSRWAVGFEPRYSETMEGRVARLEALVAQLLEKETT